MKKILSVILSCAMILSLAACKGQAPVQSSSETPQGSQSLTASAPETPEKGDAQLLSSPKVPVSPKAPVLNEYGEVEVPENTEGADFENLQAMYEAQTKMYEEIRSSLESYYDKSIAEILSHTEGKNLVYSPVNVYLALSMLAQITAGSSQQQLLSVLGQPSVEALEKAAASLYVSCLTDDGKNTTTLGNSMWLAQNLPTKDDTVKRLAEHYFASVYRGIMGSDAMNEALRAWLNDNTGHLLENAVEGVKTEPGTIIALASAIYFKAAWLESFKESSSKTQPFHNASGKEKDCTFLTENSTGSIYQGEHFTALGKSMSDGSRMLFFLPNEGTSPEELAASEEFLTFLHSNNEARSALAGYAMIHAEIPKFDISSDLDLIGSLKALGITDVFSDQTADFSGLLSEYIPAEVDSVEHAARVKIDEEGCEAAAYTLIMVKETAMYAEEPVDFICDRPFLFAIENRNGATLFTGIVNEME